MKIVQTSDSRSRSVRVSCEGFPRCSRCGGECLCVWEGGCAHIEGSIPWCLDLVPCSRPHVILPAGRKWHRFELNHCDRCGRWRWCWRLHRSWRPVAQPIKPLQISTRVAGTCNVTSIAHRTAICRVRCTRKATIKSTHWKRPKEQNAQSLRATVPTDRSRSSRSGRSSCTPTTCRARSNCA